MVTNNESKCLVSLGTLATLVSLSLLGGAGCVTDDGEFAADDDFELRRGVEETAPCAPAAYPWIDSAQLFTYCGRSAAVNQAVAVAGTQLADSLPARGLATWQFAATNANFGSIGIEAFTKYTNPASNESNVYSWSIVQQSSTSASVLIFKKTGPGSATEMYPVTLHTGSSIAIDGSGATYKFTIDGVSTATRMSTPPASARAMRFSLVVRSATGDVDEAVIGAGVKDLTFAALQSDSGM